MLKDRIEILRNANVIDHAIADYVEEVIIQVEPMNFSEPKLEMFTTHLAMALQRIKNNGDTEDMDNILWEEISKNSKFPDTNHLYQKILSNSPVEIPIGEEKFIKMHICNLLQEEEMR